MASLCACQLELRGLVLTHVYAIRSSILSSAYQRCQHAGNTNYSCADRGRVVSF